jgi:hypothetical protein
VNSSTIPKPEGALALGLTYPVLFAEKVIYVSQHCEQ